MRSVLALLALLGAGAALWLALGEEPTAPDPTLEAPGEAPAEPAPQGPLLRGAERAASLSAARGAATAGRVEVRVRRTHRPVAGVEVAVHVRGGAENPFPARRGWGAVGWAREVLATPPDPGPVVARATTDAEGLAVLQGLPLGRLRLAAAHQGQRAAAHVTLSEQLPSERALLNLETAGETLEGRVVWADGRPFAGAVVVAPLPGAGFPGWAGHASHPDAAAAPLAADGAFRLEGLRAGTYAVRAVSPLGFAAQGPPVTLPSTGPYTLRVEAVGEPLEVRVLDAVSGAALAGASVVAASQQGRAGLFHLLTTDGDGRAAALALARPAGLTVEAPGYGPVYRTVPSGPRELTVRLVRTGRVAGRVAFADGRPAAGCTVVASSPSSQRVETTADGDGRYALEDLAAGGWLVFAGGDGAVSPEVAEVRGGGYNPLVVELAGGASVTRDLVVVAAVELRGRVLDADGAPVAGARVWHNTQPAEDGDWQVAQALVNRLRLTDEQGAFAFRDAAPGFTVRLTVAAPGHPQAASGPHLLSSAAPTEVEIRLARPRHADVTVLFEDGTPVAGASVTLAMRENPSAGWTVSTPAPPTDAEGRTRAGPAGPGALGVLVSGEGLVGLREPQWIEGSEGAAGPFTVSVRLPRALVVAGRVQRADGTPVVGAQVTAQPGSGGRGGGRAANSEVDGAFVLRGLAAGPWTLAASLWNGSVHVQSPPTPVQAGDSGVVLTLDDGAQGERLRLSVRVLDDAGQPVPQAAVTLRGPDSNHGQPAVDGQAHLDLPAPAGSWVARALDAGTLVVEASHALGADTRPLNLCAARSPPLTRATREVELRLSAGRVLAGRVVASDGASLRGAVVTAWPVNPPPDAPGTQGGNARVDAEGRFRIEALVEGTYTLGVQAPADYLPLRAAPAPAGTTDLELRLTRGAAARVRVLDGEGAPVAQARVTLRPQRPPGALDRARPGNRGGEGAERQQSTDAEGVALFRGLDPEAWFGLHVTAPGARSLRPHEADGWRASDTEVRLEPAYVVAGVVRDTQGRPLGGARLLHLLGESSWNGFGASADGTFRLEGLAPGPVTLRAGPPSSLGQAPARGAANEVTVPAGTTGVVLVVDRGADLALRVLGLDGLRDGQTLHAYVLAEQGGGWRRAGQVAGNVQEGEVRLVLLGLDPAALYGVWVDPALTQGRCVHATGLRPGGEATLRAVPGGAIRGRFLAPEGATDSGVAATDAQGLRITGRVAEDGTYELVGVPAGTWTVRAWARAGRQQLEAGPVEATAGSTLDLTLAPRERSK